MAFQLDYSNSQLNKNLDKTAEKIGAVVLIKMSTEAQRLQSYMKQNRPWTDRTGMAKASLRARVSQPNEHTVRITLSHGVDYGVSLEFEHEKRYAIIAPTISLQSPKLLKDFAYIMENIKL